MLSLNMLLLPPVSSTCGEDSPSVGRYSLTFSCMLLGDGLLKNRFNLK